MPVYSMTGYASATAGAQITTESTGGTDALQTRPSMTTNVTVEIRSVNGRFLDCGFRLPDEFRSLEPTLREMLGSAFRRGKIELRLNTQRDSNTGWPQPQTEQLNRLSMLESTVQSWLPKAQGLSVQEVLQWCKNCATGDRLDEAAIEATRLCVIELKEARAREGKKLMNALLERVTRLRALASLRNLHVSIPFAITLPAGRAAELFRDNPAKQTCHPDQRSPSPSTIPTWGGPPGRLPPRFAPRETRR